MFLVVKLAGNQRPLKGPCLLPSWGFHSVPVLVRRALNCPGRSSQASEDASFYIFIFPFVACRSVGQDMAGGVDATVNHFRLFDQFRLELGGKTISSGRLIFPVDRLGECNIALLTEKPLVAQTCINEYSEYQCAGA
jgi:hypothetical protein